MALKSWVRSRPGEDVYLVYLDDSKQEKTKERFAVISAVLVNDLSFHALEQSMGYLYELLDPYVTGKFEELHAADLLAGNPPFEKVGREYVLALFDEGIHLLETLEIPVIYGAVDLNKLHASDYASANATDMAFRICIKLVEGWFRENRPVNLGLLIADDGDKGVKNAMLNAFHLLRRSVISSPPVRGELAHLHDDMYFGASKFSKGIQLADLCSLIIGRHLAGYSETEDLYEKLNKHITKFIIEPS